LSTKNVTVLLVLVLIALAAAACAEKGQASEEDKEDQAITEGSNGEKDRGRKATLELQGESGTEFSGSCTVGDQEPEEISGQVPETFSYKLKKRPLDCEISSDGEVQVGLTVGKNVHSLQRISGGTLNLTYEKGSISSVVSSSSGSSVQGSSSSSSEATAQGLGETTSESRDVSGFEAVELREIGSLSIEQTGSESLTVEAEGDVLPKLTTEVVNDRLVIGPKPGTTVQTTKPINYKLTVEALDALEVSGSGDVEAEGISTDRLAVTIGGAGNVKAGGEADKQEIDISGSGAYRAENLNSREAKIGVSGAGSAIVNVSEELDADVSGVGSVEYIGDPTVKRDASGAGRVSKH